MVLGVIPKTVPQNVRQRPEHRGKAAVNVGTDGKSSPPAVGFVARLLLLFERKRQMQHACFRHDRGDERMLRCFRFRFIPVFRCWYVCFCFRFRRRVEPRRRRQGKSSRGRGGDDGAETTKPHLLFVACRTA